MSASSSVASSTLSRSRTTVLAIAVLAAACGSYYIYSSSSSQSETSPANTSLRRSNAVHRRRRRNTTSLDNTSSVDGAGENGTPPLIETLAEGETIVDESAVQDDYSWNESQAQQPYQRSGQNIVQLLFRVSEDATKRNAYVHRGCACNGCGVVPIRGIRYRCANCSDYDLCEGCESQGLHVKTHIFYKIRVPTPSFGPRHLQPVWYTGDPDSVMRVLPKEVILKLSRETGFERPEIDAYWEQWTFMASTEWRDDPDDIALVMDRKTFERCLVPSGGYRHPPPSLIFDRMFSFYDINKDDKISFPEFLHGLAYRKKKNKWQKIFEGYDIDGDGFVERKDFLRMFRSYYVLYRQMHRDMLEGIDDQLMSTTEAHRLVSGRQPLSSAFGHDGRYPPAPDPRTGEGKTVQLNGDLEITDGKGVINESSDDTGDRDDVFKRPLPSRNFWRERNGSGEAYWEVMMNPPVSIEQMPDVIANLTRRRRMRTTRRQRAEFVDILTNSQSILSRTDQEDDEDDDSHSESDEEKPISEDSKWPPGFVTDEDAEAVDGPGTRVADVQKSSRSFVLAHAVERERIQRTIYDRWKRRQFYTDEEEGATPPSNWNETDDILAQASIVGESSNSQSRPSYHSRSSSRVRFAEDMDDFDTRSNPSTSSRSVPERWGGVEIPDAEKDAGKEILYQVTQQSFNELLDPLFKAKEDLALEAVETKSDRERYRPLFSTSKFQQWIMERRAEEEKTLQESPSRAPPPPVSRQPIWPNFPEVEVEEVRERPLEELLEATGYSIDGDSEAVVELPPRVSLSHTPEIEAVVGTSLPQAPRPPTSPTETLSIIAQYDDATEHTFSSHSTQEPTPPSPSSFSSEPSLYRDPTLPQFRPNTIPPIRTTIPPRMPRFQEHISSPPPTGSPLKVLNNPLHGAADDFVQTFEQGTETEKESFYKLWKCDQAEREKEKRGGWGRLDFEEFEAVIRRFRGEERGNKMDYLGSWIEFCIP